MFLSSQELFFKVIKDPLTKLVIPSILCQLRELQIIVNVIALVNDQIPDVKTFLPLL